MAKLFRNLGLALLLGMSAPLAAQMRPADADDIGAAIDDCAAVTSSAGASTEALAGKGWQRARFEENGRPIEPPPPLTFYGKPDNNATLMVADDQTRAPGCIVLARVGHIDHFISLRDDLKRTLGNPTLQATNTYLFRTDRHVFSLALTGSDTQPSVRLYIAPLPQDPQ